MRSSGATTWPAVAPELDERFGATFSYLARIFRSRGFDPDEADEFAQETMARAFTHLRRHGRTAHNLTPLLHTIAKNLVVERFRTGGREIAVALDERVPSADATPEDHAVSTDRTRLVHEAIEELPPKQRRAILLWLEGLSPADIAIELDIKRNAADALLHRARRYLATRLGNIRDSAWGAGALCWTKLRRTAHRVTAWSYTYDPLPLGTAIAIAATAAIMAAATPSTHAPATDGRATVSARQLAIEAGQRRSGSGVEPDRSRATEAQGTPTGSRQQPVRVSVRYPGVHVAGPGIKNKQGNEQPIVWVDIWEDPGHSGPIERKVEGITGAACDRAPSVCGGN